MGITGLIPLLKELHIISITHLKRLNKLYENDEPDFVAAIDAYSWLHKAAFGCCEKLFYKRMDEARTIYINYCMKYVDLLESYGIKPLFVFDGMPLAQKVKYTNSVRKQKRSEARLKAQALIDKGQAKKAYAFFPSAIEITFEMVQHLIEECRIRKIPYIVAPFEADVQMAFLELNGYVDFVITEDSDLVAFGCRNIIFKLNLDGEIWLYRKEKLLKALGNVKQPPIKNSEKNHAQKFSVLEDVIIEKEEFSVTTTETPANGKRFTRRSLSQIEERKNYKLSPHTYSSPKLFSFSQNTNIQLNSIGLDSVELTEFTNIMSPKQPSKTALPNMDFVKFQYMCILSGCDYLPSLPQIGLGKARRFFTLPLTPAKDISQLLKDRLPGYLKMPNLTVTDMYCEEFCLAHQLFLYQTVFDPKTQTFRPLIQTMTELLNILCLPDDNWILNYASTIFNPNTLLNGTAKLGTFSSFNMKMCDESQKSCFPLHLAVGNIDVSHPDLPMVDSFNPDLNELIKLQCKFEKSITQQSQYRLTNLQKIVERKAIDINNIHIKDFVTIYQENTKFDELDQVDNYQNKMCQLISSPSDSGIISDINCSNNNSPSEDVVNESTQIIEIKTITNSKYFTNNTSKGSLTKNGLHIKPQPVNREEKSNQIISPKPVIKLSPQDFYNSPVIDITNVIHQRQPIKSAAKHKRKCSIDLSQFQYEKENKTVVGDQNRLDCSEIIISKDGIDKAVEMELKSPISTKYNINANQDIEGVTTSPKFSVTQANKIRLSAKKCSINRQKPIPTIANENIHKIKTDNDNYHVESKTMKEQDINEEIKHVNNSCIVSSKEIDIIGPLLNQDCERQLNVRKRLAVFSYTK